MAWGRSKPKAPPEWQQQVQLFTKLLNDTQNAGGAGGGLASGVQRLQVREQRTGSSMPVSSPQGRLAGSVDEGGGSATFDFYLRGSTLTLPANVAVTELYRRVASAVCSTQQYRTMAQGWTSARPSAPVMGGHRGAPAQAGGVPRLHVPRLYAAVDTSMGPMFNSVASLVDQKLNKWWSRNHETKPFWNGFAVVQGARCKAILALAIENKPLPQLNFRGHACALGVIHALDMIVGNHDRVEKPNFGNFFIDQSGSVIAVDLDINLPPRAGGSESDWEAVVFPKDERGPPNSAMESWPFLPGECAMFGHYTVNARAELARVFDSVMQFCATMRPPDPVLTAYHTGMNNCKQQFVDAACMTFRELKNMTSDLPRWFPEDPTCSRATLLEKIRRLSGV